MKEEKKEKGVLCHTGYLQQRKENRFIDVRPNQDLPLALFPSPNRRGPRAHRQVTPRSIPKTDPRCLHHRQSLEVAVESDAAQRIRLAVYGQERSAGPFPAFFAKRYID